MNPRWKKFIPHFMTAALALSHNLKDSGLTNNGQRKLDFITDDEAFTVIQQQTPSADNSQGYTYEILSPTGNQRCEWIGTIDLSKKPRTVEYIDEIKDPFDIDVLTELVGNYQPPTEQEESKELIGVV